MKKILLFTIVFTLLLLSSCTLKNTSGESQVDKQTENTDKQNKNEDSASFTKEKKYWNTLLRDENQMAESRVEEVLIALKNEDKDALKSVFSKYALSEAVDFDGHWDYLVELFQGDIKSYDWEGNKGGPQSSKRFEYGKKQIELNSWFEVVTDKQTYIFYLLDYPVDDFNPDNVGLYALRVIKAEDDEAHICFWPDMRTPGIYRP